jgi:hypothetical protein
MSEPERDQAAELSRPATSGRAVQAPPSGAGDEPSEPADPAVPDVPAEPAAADRGRGTPEPPD